MPNEKKGTRRRILMKLGAFGDDGEGHKHEFSTKTKMVLDLFDAFYYGPKRPKTISRYRLFKFTIFKIIRY